MMNAKLDRRMLLATGLTIAAAADALAAPPVAKRAANRDFDFLQGDWEVINRQLKARGVGSDDWDVFPSSETAQLLMNGMVSVDVATFPTRGFQGTTIRLYDPANNEWAAYWVNSKTGLLQPPVYGRFENGRGRFAGDDTDGDKPVKVAFDWDATNPDAPRWSQAFSYDGGKTWETNWIMEFRRPVAN